MAEQILTQGEVDALLKGLSDGEIQTEVERTEDLDGVTEFDFYNQEKGLRGRMPTLDMINEKFCRSVRFAIFNVLRKSVDVTYDGSKIIKYEEFLRNLQVPSSLNVFQLSPLRGYGVLAIDPNLVFVIVDSYFGGDGSFHARIEGRDFTNVEQGVVKKIVDIIFSEIQETWKPVFPLEFKYVRSEMNPQFVNIIGHTELLIASKFKMEVDSLTNEFILGIPYTSLEPIREKIYGTQKSDTLQMDPKWRDKLREQFGKVPLEISGEVGTGTIDVSELLNLKVGDIIQLGTKVREPMKMKIEGRDKFNVISGIIDNSYALKIVSAIEQGG